MEKPNWYPEIVRINNTEQTFYFIVKYPGLASNTVYYFIVNF